MVIVTMSRIVRLVVEYRAAVVEKSVLAVVVVAYFQVGLCLEFQKQPKWTEMVEVDYLTMMETHWLFESVSA